jgi:hypothetical protein
LSGGGGIIVLNKMDVGTKTIFVRNPIQELKGLVAFKGLSGNAYGTGPPFLVSA